MTSNTILNRMFTQRNLKELIYRKNSEIYNTIINSYNLNKGLNNAEIINNIYKILMNEYRNEYFYENTLINKLLFGLYSPNTTTALSQISVGESKADLILVNGKSVVYEIKTELDSFYRLEQQIENYYKVFKYVVVVTSENKYMDLSRLLEDTNTGIMVITKNNTISRTLYKKAIEYDKKLTYKDIFKTLNKNEFENIINQYYNYLPQVAPAFYYDECFELFKKIPMKDIQSSMLQELKNRRKIEEKNFESIPYTLKAVSYFLDLNNKEYKMLDEFLKLKS